MAASSDVLASTSQDKNDYEMGKVASAVGTAASFCSPAPGPVIPPMPANTATPDADWAWVLERSRGLLGEATAVPRSASGDATDGLAGGPGRVALQKIVEIGDDGNRRVKSPPSDIQDIPPPSDFGDKSRAEVKGNDRADSSVAVPGDIVAQKSGVAVNEPSPPHVGGNDLITPPSSRRVMGDGPECVGISLNGVFGTFLSASSRPAGRNNCFNFYN